MKIYVHPNEDFVFVKTNHAKIKEWLRFSVKPVTHRYFSDEEFAWVLHRDHLLDAIRVGMVHGPVDYSALPIDTQMTIAAQKAAWRTQARVVEKSVGADPYRVMHLLPTAPQVIVDAVFRTLAKLHHPDMGGSEEEFKLLNDAYQRIKAGNTSR